MLEAQGVNIKTLNITRSWVLTGCRRNKLAELTWQGSIWKTLCLFWTVLGDQQSLAAGINLDVTKTTTLAMYGNAGLSQGAPDIVAGYKLAWNSNESPPIFSDAVNRSAEPVSK